MRDLLLGGEITDLDLVTEEGAIPLAQATARKLKARVTTHERFGTASVVSPQVRVDFANARTDIYTHPGALPLVELSSLEEDLGRRDFSINAMALELVGAEPGRLIDEHRGEQDIARKLVRILHDESFQDDATRTLRAVRYAGRLGFRIARRTAAALRRDRAYLDSISGTRVRHEFEWIATEAQPDKILRFAERYGLLEAVDPALRCSNRGRSALRRLPSVPIGHRDAVLFCVLLAGADATTAERAIGRLAMTNRQAEAVAGFLSIKREVAHARKGDLLPPRVVDLFDPRPAASIWACALVGPARLARLATRYLEEWRFVRPRLHGEDLIGLGIEPGPKVGSALRALRTAKIQGKVRTRKDEEAFAMALAAGVKL